MKILVVGYGSIGKRHVNNLLKIPNIEIIIYTHRSDIDNEIKNKCRIFKSLNDCIDEKPVASIISNVTSLHIEIALKLASAGLHLFIEKGITDLLFDKKFKNMMNENGQKFLKSFVNCGKSSQKLAKILDNF